MTAHFPSPCAQSQGPSSAGQDLPNSESHLPAVAGSIQLSARSSQLRVTLRAVAGSVSVYTHEVINGARIKIIDKFQAYHSFEGSIAGRTLFLTQNRRYKVLFEETDPKAWAEGLLKQGYATDPNYAKTLISIMELWKLI
jgi:hypothetical protein